MKAEAVAGWVSRRWCSPAAALGWKTSWPADGALMYECGEVWSMKESEMALYGSCGEAWKCCEVVWRCCEVVWKYCEVGWYGSCEGAWYGNCHGFWKTWCC